MELVLLCLGGRFIPSAVSTCLWFLLFKSVLSLYNRLFLYLFASLFYDDDLLSTDYSLKSANYAYMSLILSPILIAYSSDDSQSNLLSGSLLLKNPIFYSDLLTFRLALISLRFDNDIILASFALLVKSLYVI